MWRLSLLNHTTSCNCSNSQQITSEYENFVRRFLTLQYVNSPRIESQLRKKSMAFETSNVVFLDNGKVFLFDSDEYLFTRRWWGFQLIVF